MNTSTTQLLYEYYKNNHVLNIQKHSKQNEQYVARSPSMKKHPESGLLSLPKTNTVKKNIPVNRNKAEI